MTEFKLNEASIGKLTDGGWSNWSRRCRAALKYHGLWGLIEGHHTAEPSDVDAKNEWLDKNERVIGALCQLIDTPLIDGVESLNTAKAAWEYLKKKTHQGGIATKLGALQAILATCFTEPSTFSSTITDIKDHIATIYDDMAPTRASAKRP